MFSFSGTYKTKIRAIRSIKHDLKKKNTINLFVSLELIQQNIEHGFKKIRLSLIIQTFVNKSHVKPEKYYNFLDYKSIFGDTCLFCDIQK